MKLASRVLAVAYLCWGALGGAAQAQQQGQMPPPAVMVERIVAREITNPVRFSGRVEAIQAVDIRARVQGFVESVEFNGGESVDEGQLLFTIEPDGYEANLTAAQAQLASAEAAFREAERNLARNQELRESGTVAQAALDQVIAASEAAQANVQIAQAAVRQAELELGYTRIVSPISGQISRPIFTEGSLVGPDVGALARVVQLDPIRVVFAVTEGELVDLRQVQSNGGSGADPEQLVLSLELPNGTIYDQQGAFDFVAAEVDPSTGTVAVRATFPNPDALLIPNQFVTLIVREADPERRPVVPQTAVLQDRQGRFVYVLEDDGTVSQRRIETGAQVEGGWAVLSGLAAGEPVVVEGIQRLSDGMQVQPSEGQPVARGAAEGENTPAAAAEEGAAEGNADASNADEAPPQPAEPAAEGNGATQ